MVLQRSPDCARGRRHLLVYLEERAVWSWKHRVLFLLGGVLSSAFLNANHVCNTFLLNIFKPMCVGSDVQASSFFFSSFTGTHWCLFIPVWHGNHLADRFQSAFCINLISLIIRKPDSINQGKEFKKDLDFEFSWSCKYMCAWLKCSDGGKLLVEKRNEIKGRITKLLYSQFQAGCLKSDFKIRHGSSISLSDSPLVCSRVKVCFIAAAELQVQTTALWQDVTIFK